MKKTYFTNKRSSSQGFTLIELMVTIAVLSITLLVAVPGFQYVMENNRLSSNTNLLIGALNLARVEATKTGQRINTGVLNVGTGEWGVWQDADGDGNYDAGEEIRVFAAMPDTLSVTSTQDPFTFLATGFAAAAGTITICSEDDTVGASQISIALSGRVQSSSIACP